MALEARMDAGLKNDGAREFIQVFDELLGRRTAVDGRRASEAFGFVPLPFQARN